MNLIVVLFILAVLVAISAGIGWLFAFALGLTWFKGWVLAFAIGVVAHGNRN